MQKFKNIYVGATSQHVGKTTSTLGLTSTFMARGLKVGYSKPVGQNYLDIHNLKVDKDTVLFADLIDFEIIPEIHSPIIFGPGATEAFLETPNTKELHQTLLNAEKYLAHKNEIVIYEGTGHPGVGSVGGVSNAKVAKILDAGVIMVVEGGIGSTIDMLNMTTALFREEKVPIIGVIINKVIPEKLDKVHHYVGKWLKSQNLPLLGLLPYEKSLAYPLIKSVNEAVKGVLTYNADRLDNKVESIIAGSLLDLKELKDSQDLLLITSMRTINEAIRKIDLISTNHGIKNCPLSGIVATGEGQMDKFTIKYIENNNLPLIRTELDTYGAYLRVSKIEVKINRNTPWKILKAIELIEKNIDVDYILNATRL
ncbi:MAG TPA: AAA family ATPase [Saprospiraceae bacterium]|jgi:BioD-like phosphotransacetylase family protein|nr:AAA family ATPase [Saprospiraceae bacterium]HRO09464.1 AAA family ATPase [Saprospiraceae bacterium]